MMNIIFEDKNGDVIYYIYNGTNYQFLFIKVKNITIIKIGDAFHIDVGSTTLLHMHPPKHLPIGIIFGVLYELNDDEKNES